MAERLATALAAHRWVVWWDTSIDLGEAFRSAISRQLNQAKCVIVIWSRHSVESRWVWEEADSAAKRSVLVPLRIDDAAVPLGFGQLQTGDFTGWNGDGSDPRFEKLAQRVTALTGGGTIVTPEEPVIVGTGQEVKSVTGGGTKGPPPKQRWWRDPTIVAGLLAGALAVAGAIWWYLIPPQIVSFTATPSTIAAGDNVRLEWRVLSARAVFLRPGPGEPLELKDSHVVTPPIEAGDFEYRLFAEGRAGPRRGAEASVVVQVLNQAQPVAEAASFAAEWRRSWDERDESRIRAFTNEPFYCFGAWFANADGLLSSFRPGDPVWTVTRFEPSGDNQGAAAIWLLSRFRAEPSALGTSHGRVEQLLAELRAMPEDLIVVFRRAPDRSAAPPGSQVTCALISKRSGRWMVKGIFDSSSGK